MPSYVRSLAHRCLATFFLLVKVMLPVMLLVRLGDLYGLTDLLARGLAPVMGLVDLPAEAGLIWAITLLTGLYGGVGAFVSLQPEMQLTVAQVSVLSSLMLFAHALPVEQAIVRRAGASLLATTALRLGVGFAYAAIAAWICRTTGVLSEVVVLEWMPSDVTTSDWGSWMRATAQSLVSMLAIIVALFLLLDILKAIKVIGWLTRALNPGLRLLGLNPDLAPLTTIGLLLGLSYGGGLIIQETMVRRYDRRDLFLALSCLSLCHSVIEDTAVMLAVGADVWIILVGRIAATVLVIAVLARLLHRPGPRPALET
ncbi:nucleoside recognition protein [Stappia stellulata]|uniref:nucleoside recognition domain-containing protein n=1 Tax=Stappia stellulata TaxID=71235 RepID=UPI001CD5E86A|nr:nucleoside recognition domain-containing protein [Stappia stellulata]MCA1244848.1 nucleoside recognition protein [Stappia stellulata]|eukprot:jgi/Tetstr1/446342/TSEL_033884.t1